MKKLVLLSTLLLFILCSCTTYNSLNTPQIKQFKKDIKSEFELVNTITTNFSVPVIYFDYKMKFNSSEEDVIKVFNKTKEYIAKEDFQNEILDYFFKVYPVGKDSIKYYPDIYITFNLDNNNDIEYKFVSGYYKKNKTTGENKQIDKYKTTDENMEIDKYRTWESWGCKTQEVKIIPTPLPIQ